MYLSSIYDQIRQARQTGAKQLAVLIDPDKEPSDDVLSVLSSGTRSGVDYLFVGGSLLVQGETDACVARLRTHSSLPIVLFPGNHIQLSDHADAILLLSLISGRNPDFLIGQHVVAAPALRKSKLEIIPTGYLLIDGGSPTAASYISNTMPIPANKPEIAAATAMAGEMLGLQLIYLDAGSGAKQPVRPELIAEVRRHTDVPILTGGGIHSPEQAMAAAKAGADLIVIGTAFEKYPEQLPAIASSLKRISTATLAHPTKGTGKLDFL
ncbi:MAG: geranylgeranylglyceryl/heptaprenylglyceryl phosphate synthase [Saprospiraceae bacterium]|jgi:phosphoglycerol geranylgeranyltransferase|nr:geranylgeranylglyceryl/heptaprenylglyceryl phosphate synthase [Saprospiraceae bacterium]